MFARNLLFAVLTIIALLPTAAQAQPANYASHGTGTDVECQTYGCTYGHDRCHYGRDGSGGCTVVYGTAYERLPDGPDDRWFAWVEWPVVRGDVRYDPARRSEWDRLASCESTYQWHYNGSSGFDGGLQFSPSTWRAYGGEQYAAYAWGATPEQQIAVAERVLWAGWGPHGPQGRGAWPGCLAKGQGAPYPPQ